MPRIRSAIMKYKKPKTTYWGGDRGSYTGDRRQAPERLSYTGAKGEKGYIKDWSRERKAGLTGDVDPEFDKWMRESMGSPAPTTPEDIEAKRTGEERRDEYQSEFDAINKGFKDPETGRTYKLPPRSNITAGQVSRRPTPKDREGFKDSFIQTNFGGEHPKDINPREESALARADLPNYFDEVSRQENWGKVYDDRGDLPSEQKAVWTDLAGRFVQKAQFEAETRKKENTRRLYGALERFDKTVQQDEKVMKNYSRLIADVTKEIENKQKPPSRKQRLSDLKRITEIDIALAKIFEGAEKQFDEETKTYGDPIFTDEQKYKIDALKRERQEIEGETPETDTGEIEPGADDSLLPSHVPTGETSGPSPDQKAMQIGRMIKARMPDIGEEELAKAINVELGKEKLETSGETPESVEAPAVETPPEVGKKPIRPEISKEGLPKPAGKFEIPKETVKKEKPETDDSLRFPGGRSKAYRKHTKERYLKSKATKETEKEKPKPKKTLRRYKVPKDTAPYKVPKDETVKPVDDISKLKTEDGYEEVTEVKPGVYVKEADGKYYVKSGDTDWVLLKEDSQYYKMFKRLKNQKRVERELTVKSGVGG